MPTLQQIAYIPRLKKQIKSSSPKLDKNPQKKAICLRVLTISPKKPNSANRRIVKVRLIGNKTRLTAKVPGESHNLQQHSTVLIHGAKVKDLIGVSYAVVRGKFDLLGVSGRKTRRSLYGVKKTVQ
jgi:small subunit ribosomal protein S12